MDCPSATYKQRTRDKSSPSKLNSQQRKRNEFEGTFKINRNDLNPKLDRSSLNVSISKKELSPDKGKTQKSPIAWISANQENNEN